MNTTVEPNWKRESPQTLLLATDLSSRCDRAAVRAAQLSDLWKARLVVLNVIQPEGADNQLPLELPSWRDSEAPQEMAESEVRRQFGESLQDAEIRVAHGDPAPTIEAVAREVGADLIITGVARDEPLGRQVLGSTVDKLARMTTAPLLVVKSRMWPYGEILVATDFSEPSRQALMGADRFFPSTPLTVLHGWEVPFAGFLDKPDFRTQVRDLEQQGGDEFLDRSMLSSEARARVKVLVEHGRPEVLVREYMLDNDVDLVVIGTQGRSGVFGRRLGGTAKRILQFSPGDVLLIREAQKAD